MTSKIADLKNGMKNVQIEGIVSGKSELTIEKNGKNFHFYMSDNDKNSIRIVAFKNAAEKWFDNIENDKTYRISKAAVKMDGRYNVPELQIILVLTTDVSITPIETKMISQTSFTALSTLKEKAHGSIVNVIGRIVKFYETQCCLKNGELKNILKLTLMDEDENINVTFWDHHDMIKGIKDEELKNTVIAIKNARINIFKGAIGLNVGETSVLKINSKTDSSEKWKVTSVDNDFFNLSQRSESDNQHSQVEYSTAENISALKRDLQKTEEKQERLKIRKMALQNQLRSYEAQVHTD